MIWKEEEKEGFSSHSMISLSLLLFQQSLLPRKKLERKEGNFFEI